MGTETATADYVLEQLHGLPVRLRPMFGEYCLYFDDKVVGFVCDDMLFVKPTDISNNFLSNEHLAPPYQGAKNYFCVPQAKLDDAPWIQKFITATSKLVPAKTKTSRK